jgi:hypothetical protein
MPEIMKTTQALVAVGGKAKRLRAGGVRVPVSKSFMHFSGKPLLFWSLRSLHFSGIREIVLCLDKDEQEAEASLTLSSLPEKFEEVRFFKDDGRGVHGLPHYAKHLLGDRFIFECGHSITPPEQYAEMDRLKENGNAVFTAYKTHPENRRYPIGIVGDEIRLTGGPSAEPYAFAHPLILDQQYTDWLPKYDFNFVSMVNHYVRQRSARYVMGKMPPEFDIPEEYAQSMEAYRTWVHDSFTGKQIQRR